MSWGQLASAVRTRRETLGLRQKDISTRGGPSYETIRLIEKGEPGSYQPRTLAGLDRSLAWKAGTTQAILNGTADPDPQEWVDRAVMFVGEGYTVRSHPAGTTVSSGMPQFEVSTETQTLLAQNDTARAGLAFLDLVHRHYGAERESAAVDHAVREFVRYILATEDA